jgi:hypothetical protein
VLARQLPRVYMHNLSNDGIRLPAPLYVSVTVARAVYVSIARMPARFI